MTKVRKMMCKEFPEGEEPNVNAKLPSVRSSLESEGLLGSASLVTPLEPREWGRSMLPQASVPPTPPPAKKLGSVRSASGSGEPVPGRMDSLRLFQGVPPPPPPHRSCRVVVQVGGSVVAWQE